MCINNMVGIKKKPYVDKLKKLAQSLGFIAYENLRYPHYWPDLVWRKGDMTVGFEVEYGRVNGKKITGDAFWLCRTFDIGFIQVVKPERLKRYANLVKDLDVDFKMKVHVISTDLNEIITILMV